MANEAVREFFDKLAPEWQDAEEEKSIRDKLVGMMGIPEKSDIIDIGSGKGIMLAHLLKTNPETITAVDISEKMLSYAMDRYSDPRIAFLAEDLLEAKLPEFDAAVIFNAYPHFLDKQALAEKMGAIVKPGGLFIICHSRSRQIINRGHEGGL